MKTKVEVLGYEIEIEEVDGVVTVKAELDGDVVEEFTLETPGDDSQGQGQSQDDSDDDVKGFGDFEGQEQSDFEGDSDEDDDDEMGQAQSQDSDEDDDDRDGAKLESFQSFFTKRK